MKGAKRAKRAKIHIELPDGTVMDAEGPEAEMLARRAFMPQVWYPYLAPVPYVPTWPTWRWTLGDVVPGSTTTTSSLTTTCGSQ